MVQKKLVKLQEKKVELAAPLEDTKMLAMKMSELDPNVAKIIKPTMLGC